MAGRLTKDLISSANLKENNFIIFNLLLKAINPINIHIHIFVCITLNILRSNYLAYGANT